MPLPVSSQSAGTTFDPSPQASTPPPQETIVTHQGGSSFDMVIPVKALELLVETTDGDTVEISSPEPSPTYAPPSLDERFRFDIANGMFDKNLRFSALRSRSSGTASSTYGPRESIENQLIGISGGRTAYSALFRASYDDANPNPSEATSNVDARTSLSRIIDQNLALLNSL